VSELSDTLKKARTHIHSFSRATFQQVAAPGEEAVKKTDDLVKKAQEEFNFRQLGLFVSIGLIGLLMLAIYAKLRQLEAAAPGAPSAAEISGAISGGDGTFFPRGAIFFFVVLLAFYAALWFVIYWLMIARS